MYPSCLRTPSGLRSLDGTNLDDVLCIKEERKVGEDSSFSLDGVICTIPREYNMVAPKVSLHIHPGKKIRFGTRISSSASYLTLPRRISTGSILCSLIRALGYHSSLWAKDIILACGQHCFPSLWQNLLRNAMLQNPLFD